MFGQNKKLLPLESILLESLFKAVPKETAECLRKQVSAITKIQRLWDNKEINLYMSAKGADGCDENICVMQDVEEFKFATIKFIIPGVNVKNKVDFWLVKGRLFSLNFDTSPKKIGKTKEVEVQDIILYGEMEVYNEYIKHRTRVVEFLKSSGRFNINEWSVFDKNNVATANFAGEDYYVLAKYNNDACFLLVKYGSDSIYYVKHEDKLPQLVG